MKNPENMTYEELLELKKKVHELLDERRPDPNKKLFDRDLLTDYQKEVLNKIQHGYSYKALAEELGVTQSAVRLVAFKAFMNAKRMYKINTLKDGKVTSDMDISWLGFPIELTNRIKYAGYESISDLMDIPDSKLLAIKNIGPKTVSELRRAITYVKEKEN